jgi:hypothetical protein
MAFVKPVMHDHVTTTALDRLFTTNRYDFINGTFWSIFLLENRLPHILETNFSIASKSSVTDL